MYLDAALLGLIYICDYYMFLDLALDHLMSLSLVTFFILKPILSYVGIANLAFFWFPFAMNTFFYPFIFNLFVSLSLKWDCCRQHIYWSGFCFHWATQGVLIGAFNPVIFKVIIDIYVLIGILLIFSDLCCFFLLFLFFSLVVWWLSLVLCLDSFLCVYVCTYYQFLVCGLPWGLYIAIYIYVYIWKWQPIPVFLPRESLRQRSLVDCCP